MQYVPEKAFSEVSCTKYVIDRPTRDTSEKIFIHIHD